ncbi:MAG: alpha/beta hydrolase, partial [Pseudonocardia sp.]|nr:alpha/beta hydrolase [Pseudonocardia sp.]
MDRRGRCGSGDATRYAIEEEAFDVASVVDAIADATGGPVDVLGHSHGGICALEAALLTTGLRRLVLYEPPLAAASPPGWLDRMGGLLAQGRRAEIVLAMLGDLAGLTAEELALAQADPSWPGRVAAAHTVVREVRAVEAYRFEPARFASLAVPILLLDGGASPPFLRAATETAAAGLPGARVVTLAGQAHVAQNTAPELFCSAVLDFLGGGR